MRCEAKYVPTDGFNGFTFCHVFHTRRKWNKFTSWRVLCVQMFESCINSMFLYIKWLRNSLGWKMVLCLHKTQFNALAGSQSLQGAIEVSLSQIFQHSSTKHLLQVANNGPHPWARKLCSNELKLMTVRNDYGYDLTYPSALKHEVCGSPLNLNLFLCNNILHLWWSAVSSKLSKLANHNTVVSYKN